MGSSIGKFKKIIVVIIIVLLFILMGLGVYSYFNFAKNVSINNINVSSGKLYPVFSSDVTEYTVYTDLDEVTINCDSSDYVNGCNEKIVLDKKVVEHVITAKDVKYVVKVVKNDSNSSEVVKIKDIEGVPTTWVKGSTIKVNVNKIENIDGITYSFDGGKTWQDENRFKVNSNTKLQILVKDYFGYVSEIREVIIDKVDNDKPSVIISKENVSDGKVLLTATAIDGMSGIKGYSWNNNKYSNTNTFVVNKAGKYTVVVKDNVGNKSDVVNIEVNESDLKKIVNNEYSALFDSNGADSISKQVLKCTTKGSSCTVIAPTINRKGYNVLGWSKNSNSITAEYKVGSRINITGGEKLYAVTSKKVDAFFNKNGASSINASKLSCNLYNRQISCNVKLPIITRNGYNVLGWSKSNNSTKAQYKVGSSLKITGNEKLYAITSKKVIATFNKNGASNIGSTKLSCNIYNNNSRCTVKLPTIKPSSGFSVIGWGNSASSTTRVASVNERVSLSKNMAYYAVTKSSDYYKVTFNKNGASSIGANSLNCYRYNGSSHCTVKLPTISPSSGFSVIGWGSSPSSTTKVASIGQSVSLSKNMTYYAITRTNSYHKVTFNKNGASSIGATSVNCYGYNGNSRCTVKLPTISPSNGFSVIGWGSSPSSTTKVASIGQNLSINKSVTYYAVTKSSDYYKATFNKNGASSISANSLNCYRYNGSSRCTVKLPTITPSNGFSVVGWGSSPSSTTKVASIGQNVSISKNTTYYAVTRSSDYYKVTFNKNGASSIGATSLNCYRYNNASSCTVKLPTITPVSGFDVIGWGSSASSTTKSASVGQSISLSKNTTYYAITKSKTPYKVTFWPRTASIGSYDVGTGIVPSCFRYNGATSCSVTTPAVKIYSNQQFLGWTTNVNATSSNIKGNQAISVNKDATYYAIIKQTLTAYYKQNGADKLSISKASCTSYGDGCVINQTPVISKKGYEVWGLSTSSNSGYGTALNKKIYKDTTYYARVYNQYRKKPLSVAANYSVGNMQIEVEKSSNLSYSTYSTYYNFIKKVNSKMPYLYDAKGKINMMSNNTFVSIWGNWAGMAYGTTEYRSNDVALTSSVSEYSKGTFVHEQGHVFDTYYGLRTGKGLSAQTDIKDLYNKYKKLSASKRPLRDYAYTNEAEFVAESIEYYYYYKFETVKCPNGGNQITSDIINALEKYFKIAKNGYK